jgi:DNA-directed RNA polymerase subunit M/transcription elongation factor TFIIS
LRKIQYVSKYLALAEEGLVPRLECPMDQGLLLPNQNLNDEIFLYCNTCEYKRFIGYSFYSEIEAEVKKHV